MVNAGPTSGGAVDGGVGPGFTLVVELGRVTGALRGVVRSAAGADDVVLGDTAGEVVVACEVVVVGNDAEVLPGPEPVAGRDSCSPRTLVPGELSPSAIAATTTVATSAALPRVSHVACRRAHATTAAPVVLGPPPTRAMLRPRRARFASLAPPWCSRGPASAPP